MEPRILVIILGFLILQVSGSKIISLDTEDDLISGHWNVSSDCEYFDTSSIENICPDSDNGNTTTEGVGFWTSCSKQRCSITYTAESDVEIPVNLTFRIYGLLGSHLILKTDFDETRFPVNTIGWGDYSIQGNFKGSRTLTLIANDGSEIIIFDEIVVETNDSSSTTTDLSTAETTVSPSPTSESTSTLESSESTLTVEPTESTSTVEQSESTYTPTILTTLPSNPPEETSISSVTAESTTPKLSTLSSAFSEISTPESTNPIIDTSTDTTDTSTATSVPPPRADRLDTVADVTDDNPWSVDCPYGETLENLSEICPGIGHTDSENKTGYWTPCNKMSCQIIYKEKLEPETVLAILSRQLSFRSFIAEGSQLSITADNGAAFGFPGTGEWMDIPFINVRDAITITVTADNGGSGIVIIDEIRVKTVGGSIITTSEPTTTTGSGSGDQSEFYLLLILIAVGLVVLLMTLLILITCLRRICCKRRPTTEEESVDNSLEMKYDDFRPTVVKLPVPPVTPPPGYEGQEYSNGGLNLQSSPRHLGTFKPLPLEAPSQPSVTTKRNYSPYREGKIYYSGTPTKSNHSNAYGDQEVPGAVLPRLVRADRHY